MGVLLAIAGAGIALAPRVGAVLGAWCLMASVAALAAWLAARAGRHATPHTVGRLVEAAARTRAGSIVGLLAPRATAGGSPDLGRLPAPRAPAPGERAAPPRPPPPRPAPPPPP